MKTEQWVKKLGGHAGELYVAAELSKRGIPNALLPENFSDDDVMFGAKDGRRLGFIQVKACHPERSESFILRIEDENWRTAQENEFVVFVWLGSPSKNEGPEYWVAPKKAVGEACSSHGAHGTSNWERRFYRQNLDAGWKNNWRIVEEYLRGAGTDSDCASA
ncbi:MAG TPA: hypothetical protein VGR84_15625 [Candidatus Acidoferrales bacterium]|nr:hypothetical protein [Candidatus Acidoferrales bacterium]